MGSEPSNLGLDFSTGSAFPAGLFSAKQHWALDLIDGARSTSSLKTDVTTQTLTQARLAGL